ncbi:hypothetical protein B0H65DRAFT_512022 [Neurospora tetraspora]|uniref:LysM domain-containing protein n=1 Tax=Neurospora tetraspora TaxID=94610 RepID=A0AAE0J7T3_9PEZI|nr:hypothetical protein B0H65DRAFT_512022 [Neurospora tetraspora]
MLSSASDLLVIGSLIEAAVVGASPIFARDGPSPLLPYDSNASQYCTGWVDVTSDISCPTLLDDNYITLEEFRRWNPSITADCGNLVVGKSYCVEAYNEPAPAPLTTTTTTTSSSTTAVTTTSTTTTLKTSTTTTTQPPTTTIPSNGITTPSPAQPFIVSNCDKFYLVKAGDTCDAITQSHGITLAQFLAWNPSAGSACTGLWANAYACVSIIGHEPTIITTIATTTTTAGNGIATPTPIQPNMVANCDSFYKVNSGDTCDVIAAKSGISSAQIISWNPSVGSGCTSLWLDYVSSYSFFFFFFFWFPFLSFFCLSSLYICISIVGHTPTTTTTTKAATTTTKTGNGIATPTPIHSGQTCETIVAKYKITLANFVKWNPAVGGTACTGLWANTYACVAVL